MGILLGARVGLGPGIATGAPPDAFCIGFVLGMLLKEVVWGEALLLDCCSVRQEVRRSLS